MWEKHFKIFTLHPHKNLNCWFLQNYFEIIFKDDLDCGLLMKTQAQLIQTNKGKQTKCLENIILSGSLQIVQNKCITHSWNTNLVANRNCSRATGHNWEKNTLILTLCAFLSASHWQFANYLPRYSSETILKSSLRPNSHFRATTFSFLLKAFNNKELE